MASGRMVLNNEFSDTVVDSNGMLMRTEHLQTDIL